MEIDLPPLYEFEGAEDLAAALMAAGPSEPGGMADAPLSWVAIRAWSELTETPLSPGDYEALRDLSGEWVQACEEYRHHLVPPPWGHVRTKPEALGNQIKGLFRGLIAAQQAEKQKGQPSG